VLAKEAMRLNEAFNHWIVHRTPFVTVKTAMTLDGKIATAAGKSKWITGERARAYAMKLRMGADAILVGINTVLADDPALTVRQGQGSRSKIRRRQPRRVILDALARTPLTARIISDDQAPQTTIVVSWLAPRKRVVALSRFVNVWVAPSHDGKIDLRWLLPKLGADSVTGLLVEGGGEVNASFLEQRLAQRIAFFYAPMILGGHNARKAVAGAGAKRLSDAIDLRDVEWRTLGPDLLLTALVR
jgi:diaminohydroxyphosphoribosylaminopyrimidine deaminase/5-amino-6-(5-phosphoribosylamino)uracil reductase